MTRGSIDLEKLRVAPRRMSRGNLLIIAERAAAHVSRRKAFPEWLPSDVMKEAEALSVVEAERVLSAWFVLGPDEKQAQGS